MRTWLLWIRPWMLKIRWARSYVCIMIILRIGCYLIAVVQIFLETMVMMIEIGYAMNKIELKLQVHQNWTFGSPAAQHYLIGKVITPSSGVSLRSMSTWWKAYFISYQMDLVWPQNHIGKASKPSQQVTVVCAKSCIVVVDLIFTLGTLAQVEHAPRRWRTLKRCPRTSSSLATSLKAKHGRPS
jgi:hypothetical protein